MPPTLGLEALGVKVESIEKEIDELKNDRRESQKDLMDVIRSNQETNIEIKEYIAKQTVHMEMLQQHVMKQDQQMVKMDEKVDDKFEKMNEKVDKVSHDVQVIKTQNEVSKTENNTVASVVSGFLKENGKPLLIILAVIVAGIFGLNFKEVVSLLFGG